MKMTMVVATNRPTFWGRFCDHLAKNSVDLEVLFVGPVSHPGTPFAVPVRFLTTGANPALAWEIGARAATGELLGLAADDVCYTAGFLDDVHREMSKQHHLFDMFTGRYVHNHVCQLAGQRLMSQSDLPLLPVGGFAYTAGHHRLGGVDRRFHAVLWDTDLYASFYEAGGRATLVGSHTCHEVNDVSKLFVDHSARDKEVMRRLWWRNGKYGMVRNEPRQPYMADETKL